MLSGFEIYWNSDWKKWYIARDGKPWYKNSNPSSKPPENNWEVCNGRDGDHLPAPIVKYENLMEAPVRV